jgi:hypothetical protein
MKSIMIVALTTLYLACGAQTVQQEKSANKAIKTFIAQTYPEVKSKMILEEYPVYRAVFTLEGHRCTSLFSFDGNWIKTEKKIKPVEIEDSVRQSLLGTKYKTCKVCSAAEILSADNSGKIYRVEVRCDLPDTSHDPDRIYGNSIRQYHKLYFTASGALVKDELEPDESLPYITWGND